MNISTSIKEEKTKCCFERKHNLDKKRDKNCLKNMNKFTHTHYINNFLHAGKKRKRIKRETE